MPETPGVIRTQRSDRSRVPWKNGQGVTQVVAETDTWRVSIADEPVHSVFSTIEDYDRALIPIGSHDMELSYTEIGDAPNGIKTIVTQVVRPLQIITFRGGLAPTCRADAPTMALNVMTLRGHIRAHVEVGSAPVQFEETATRIYVFLPSEDAVVVPPYATWEPKPTMDTTVISIRMSSATC